MPAALTPVHLRVARVADQGPDGAPLFEADAIERAKQLMSSIPGGVGAYSESQGAFRRVGPASLCTTCSACLLITMK